MKIEQITIWFAGFCLLFILFGCETTPSRQKPNIVILFCDDMGYGDMTHTGHPTIYTPNLDKMAANGMKLTNFYSSSPACTASRYSLLTGKYPIRSGFDWVLNPNSKRGIHPKETTLAELLKNEGYATACYGKWHLGSTKKEYLPLQNGFDEYLGLPYSNDMRPPKWPSIPLLSGNDTLELDPDQSILTKLYTEKAIGFIKKNKSNLFFIYLPYAMPHVPLYASKDFEEKSARGKYGDVIEEIDWSVGQIIKTLKEQNLDENTLVFFTSDNGPWIIKGLRGGSSGLFRDGKGSTWEGGMRVPAIAYWPKTIPPATVCMTPASTVDLFETIRELTGASIPNGKINDGNSIAPLLLQNGDLPANRAFFFYGRGNELHAIRKGSWKLHIKTYSQTGKQYFDGKIPLLFNLNEDPSEEHDVAEEHPAVIQDLMAEIERHKKEVEATSNFFDKYSDK